MVLKDLDEYKDLLFEKKALAHLAITRKNNVPHVTPVWFNLSEEDYKNQIITINSARGRVKSNVLKMNSKVSISIVDPDNSYRYLGFNGEIIHIVDGEEAFTHIDQLTKKYLGKDKYPYLKPGEERIKYIIKIETLF